MLVLRTAAVSYASYGVSVEDMDASQVRFGVGSEVFLQCIWQILVLVLRYSVTKNDSCIEISDGFGVGFEVNPCEICWR